MRYGELRRFVIAYGRHSVWTLRKSGTTWSEIEDQLGIGEDLARDWYLRWGEELDQGFLDTWSNQLVKATIGVDSFRVLSVGDPADPEDRPTAHQRPTAVPQTERS